jgi:HlyD family secretion protein
VLLVPNAALRFMPAAATSGTDPRSGGIVSQLMPRPPRSATPRKAGTTTANVKQVWVLRDGAPVAVAVTQGVSDGRRTEVEGDLREGDAVIVDQIAATA